MALTSRTARTGRTARRRRPALAHRHGGAARAARRVGQRGAALVELAFVGLLLAAIIFSTIDFGRVAQYQNRMSNAAREGAASARLRPTSVDSGCNGRLNVEDRAAGQDLELSEVDGFDVTIAKVVGDTTVPYHGCGTPSGGVTLEPGDRIEVTVTADVAMFSPFTHAITGRTITLRRSVEAVVQG